MKMKKFMAAALAAGICFLATPVAAQAATVPVASDYTYDTNSEDTKKFAINFDEIEVPGKLLQVKFHIDGDFSSAGWVGGGGCFGISAANEEWVQIEYAITDDHNEYVIDIPADKDIIYEGGHAEIQYWWGSVNTATVSNVELVFEGGETADATADASSEGTTAEATEKLPQTGLVSTVVFLALGSAITAAGAVVAGKKEK